MKFVAIEVYPNPREAKAWGRLHVRAERIAPYDQVTDVLSSLASIPAERLLRPHRTQFGLVLTVCDDDYKSAKTLCDQFGVDVDKLLKESGQMVRRLAPSIYRVAKALEEEKRLSYKAVLKLCPEAVAECETYLASPDSSTTMASLYLKWNFKALCEANGIDPLDFKSLPVQTDGE